MSMSVLINGMDTPTSCSSCPMLEGDKDDGLCHAASRWLDDDEYWTWYVYPEGDMDFSKPCNCPLIELPPHGRLIDADALREQIAERHHYFGRLSDPLCLIEDAPTIIEAEEGDG